MKPRALILSAFLVVALAVTGCGGGGSSSPSPASVAPSSTPVYVEVAVQPEAEISADIDALAQNVAGIDNVGELVVEELEKSASDSGEPVDFAKEVEPWLGEKAGIFLQDYNGSDFNGYGVAVQTTDSGAAQEFVDKQTKSATPAAKDGSFDGVDYKVESDGKAIGMIGDLIVLTEDEKTFHEAIEASAGESLADQESFTGAVDAASSDGFAQVFVDVGGLVKQAGSQIDAETELFLEAAGIEPRNATAVASLVPGSNQVEIDLASNVGSKPPSGDASQLLGSLPAGSFAAFASSDFGARFGEAINRLDAEGIPGTFGPGELESGLGALGIDVKKLSASITGFGVFGEGNTAKNVTGAAVLTTSDPAEATKVIGQVGKLLRLTGSTGVTSLSGDASGFSVRSPELGRQPLVVATKGDRIAISYGLAASAAALTATSGASLAEDSAYKEAVAALGDTPITGFVDGPAAVRLFTDVAASSDSGEREGFEKAKPYLEKITFAGIGAGSEGELSTAKVIVGFSE